MRLKIFASRLLVLVMALSTLLWAVVPLSADKCKRECESHPEFIHNQNLAGCDPFCNGQCTVTVGLMEFCKPGAVHDCEGVNVQHVRTRIHSGFCNNSRSGSGCECLRGPVLGTGPIIPVDVCNAC